MNFLKRLAFLGFASGVLLAVEITGEKSQAVGQVPGFRVTPVYDAAPAAPIRTAYGRVRSIVGQALTLDVGHDMTFRVDENTDVLARGAARRTAGGDMPITDLVRTGDIALVAYRELNGSMRVLEIQIKGRNTIATR